MNRKIKLACLGVDIMGKFANDVILRLKEQLAQNTSSYTWETEYRIAETPVDIAGIDRDHYVLIELEWRRADPADNAAKIFRHISTREISANQVTILQLFTNHYDLNSGNVSSKRKNAEFVGEVAASSLDRLAYHPLDFKIDPPKSGKERPPEWVDVTDSTAKIIVSKIVDQ